MQQAAAKTKTKGKAMTMTTMTNGQVTAPTARPLPAINDVVPEKLISKRDVARRLGKTIRTIDHWMQRGLLPYYKIGRTVSFRWSEVERRLAEFKVGGKVPLPISPDGEKTRRHGDQRRTSNIQHPTLNAQGVNRENVSARTRTSTTTRTKGSAEPKVGLPPAVME